MIYCELFLDYNLLYFIYKDNNYGFEAVENILYVCTRFRAFGADQLRLHSFVIGD